jgi:hypothetical protein
VNKEERTKSEGTENGEKDVEMAEEGEESKEREPTQNLQFNGFLSNCLQVKLRIDSMAWQ